MVNRLKETIHAARFNLPVALFLGFFLGILSLRNNPVLNDLDVGWLIRTGEYLLEHWRLPQGDIYSFSNPGKPWVLYQWGFEVYVGWLHRLAKLGGVVWGGALVIGLTYAILLFWLLRIGLSPGWAMGLGIITAMANIFHWYSRPLTVTLLLYVVLLCVLESYRLKPRRQLRALPAIFLLWANMHLGFIWGLMVVLIYGVWAFAGPAAFRGADAERDPWLLGVFPLCLGAAPINPYGPKLFSYLWNLAFSHAMNSRILELQSPNFHDPYLFFILLQIALLLWLSGPNYPGRNVLLSLITITLWMGLFSVRHLTFFSIPATLHIAYCVKARNNWPYPDRARISKEGWLVAGLAVVLSLIWIVTIERWRPGFYQFAPKRIPKGAAQYVAGQANSSQPLKIFNFRDSWGNYFIYTLYPHIRVYIDTRFDMYGDKFFGESIKTLQKALRDFTTIIPLDADFVLVDKKILEDQHIDNLQPKGPFRLVYEDKQALLYRFDRRSWQKARGLKPSSRAPSLTPQGDVPG